jgi:hypothetical protein
MNSLSESDAYATNSQLLLVTGVVGAPLEASGIVPPLKTRIGLITLFRSITLCLIFILPGTAKSDPSMKDAILKALEQVNVDVTERRWQSYYFDVSDRFKDVIKDTSFEQLLSDFAELDKRIPTKFNARNFEDNKIYYVAIEPPNLSGSRSALKYSFPN